MKKQKDIYLRIDQKAHQRLMAEINRREAVLWARFSDSEMYTLMAALRLVADGQKSELTGDQRDMLAKYDRSGLPELHQLRNQTMTDEQRRMLNQALDVMDTGDMDRFERLMDELYRKLEGK